MTTNATNGLAGGNIALGKATLAAGTTTTISTTGTLPFSIQGRVYSRTALTNSATPTTDINTGAAFTGLTANKACIFLFALDSTSAVRVAQGPIVALSAVTGGLSAVQFPELDDDHTPFGYLYAQAGSTLSGTWTFGSSNLSGVSGMTYSFRDLCLVPGQPITA